MDEIVKKKIIKKSIDKPGSICYNDYSKDKEDTEMTTANLTRIPARNEGDAREWSVCAFMNAPRAIHDSKAYDKDSDCNAGDLHISVKSSAFTLMAGSLCEGLTDFDSIWNLYAERVHSNAFAYVTAEFVMYLMNLEEFKKFVYAFCKLERESEKNGGAMKIRCRKESGKMLRWLAENAAA